MNSLKIQQNHLVYMDTQDEKDVVFIIIFSLIFLSP
jgi:hypothetical protein